MAARAAWADEKGWEKAMGRFRSNAAPHQEPELIVAATDEVKSWFIANGIPIA